MMLLQYTGNEKYVSFNQNSIYEVEISNCELGEGYAIFDEGDDWYWYSKKYVEKNFIVPTFKGEDESAGSDAV